MSETCEIRSVWRDTVTVNCRT